MRIAAILRKNVDEGLCRAVKPLSYMQLRLSIKCLSQPARPFGRLPANDEAPSRRGWFILAPPIVPKGGSLVRSVEAWLTYEPKALVWSAVPAGELPPARWLLQNTQRLGPAKILADR